MSKTACVFCRVYLKLFWRSLAGLLLFVGLVGFAEAAGGIVANDLSSEAYAVVIDSFGRIVTAGSAYRQFEIALTRYNSDGSLDTSFGNGGVAITDFSSVNRGASPQAMAMDSLGRIIVVCNTYFDSGRNGFLLARYNPDGSLDTAFGNGGVVADDFSVSRSVHAQAMAMDSLGRIVLAGSTGIVVASSNTSFMPPGPSSMALARYNPDGTLDATFG